MIAIYSGILIFLPIPSKLNFSFFPYDINGVNSASFTFAFFTLKVQIWALKYFDFVTEEMINNAVGDAVIVSGYIKRNFDLPHINTHDHRAMMKLNVVKKKRSFRRIMQRNRNDIISKQVIREDDNEGFEHLPDNILPQGLENLRKDSVAVNNKSYTIMEW